MVFSFQGLQEQDEGFEASIDTQLVEYHGAPEGEAGITQREVAVKEIARILELERSIMQFAAPVTRLTRSRHIARRRRDRGVESGEPISTVNSVLSGVRESEVNITPADLENHGSLQCCPPAAYGGQSNQASREELGAGLPEAPPRAHSEKN
ncbi:MAG: hypothetical protein Q9215_004115 [Flavoplaca cf. flavocitrina]